MSPTTRDDPFEAAGAGPRNAVLVGSIIVVGAFWAAPLAGVSIMLDAGDLPEAAQRHAELIRASGAALLTVVNDILDFSKIEAGAVELEVIPFSPVALAQRSAAILRGYAGTKALDIDVELGERLPACLLGDEARLRQVLLNFLNNAVKFTSRGRVTLRVTSLDGRTVGSSPEGGETVRFEVMDTGIGIPDAKQHRLFERFSQVDSSVARRFGGSGLGLAICKKLVALMGGTIGVSSREGEGSTFWFTVTLPRAAPATPVHPPGPATNTARPARILVVEDIDINQRLAVALLESVGHDVDVVGDGSLAVAAVATTPYDLVLMDVQMPGMDGVTATRLIRESDGPNRDVPIVAMTANVFPEQVRVFREAGMDGHVGKPLNRAQLYATVKRWTTPARHRVSLRRVPLHPRRSRPPSIRRPFGSSGTISVPSGSTTFSCASPHPCRTASCRAIRRPRPSGAGTPMRMSRCRWPG